MTEPSAILQLALPIAFQLSRLEPSKSTVHPEPEDMDEQAPSAATASAMTNTDSFFMGSPSLRMLCILHGLAAVSMARSFHAYVPFPDHLPPFLGFALQVRGELLGRARDDLEPHLLEEAGLLRRRERVLDPGVERRDDRCGRPLGRDHAVPGHEFVPRQPGLGDRRHVRERWRALGAAHAEHDEL